MKIYHEEIRMSAGKIIDDYIKNNLPIPEGIICGVWSCDIPSYYEHPIPESLLKLWNFYWEDSDGDYHRDDDLPAISIMGVGRAYVKHGNFHRINGPAAFYPDGRERYYIDGEEYTKEQHIFWREFYT